MKSKITLEIIWWIATAIIVSLFILPIYMSIGDRYEFYLPNIILITLFVTFTRYIFLLKHTFLAEIKWLKVALIFLPIPLFFFATNSLFNFQDFLDREGHIKMLSQLNPDEAMEVSKYIKYQFIFFGTGAMTVIFLLPVRMIVSVWRGINRGTV